MLFMAISVGGVAVWTMHFVGMSAVSFVDPDGVAMTVHYRVDLTMTSLVIVIILCYIGIYMCSHDAAFVMDNVDTVDAFIAQASKMSISEMRKMRSKNRILFMALFQDLWKVILGALIMALGVCLMHYLGMMSIVIDKNVVLRWDPYLIATSVLIAIVSYFFLYKFLYSCSVMIHYMLLLL